MQQSEFMRLNDKSLLQNLTPQFRSLICLTLTDLNSNDRGNPKLISSKHYSHNIQIFIVLLWITQYIAFISCQRDAIKIIHREYQCPNIPNNNNNGPNGTLFMWFGYLK